VIFFNACDFRRISDRTLPFPETGLASSELFLDWSDFSKSLRHLCLFHLPPSMLTSAWILSFSARSAEIEIEIEVESSPAAIRFSHHRSASD
jgi:hypothetical protein